MFYTDFGISQWGFRSNGFCESALKYENTMQDHAHYGWYSLALDQNPNKEEQDCPPCYNVGLTGMEKCSQCNLIETILSDHASGNVSGPNISQKLASGV